MKNYLQYRRMGFGPSKAFELSHDISPAKAVVALLLKTLGIGLVVLLLYGLVQWNEDRVERAIQDKRGYTKTLERILARCLDGQSIVIGSELYLCGATPLGIKL